MPRAMRRIAPFTMLVLVLPGMDAARAERPSPIVTELVNLDDDGRQGRGHANRPVVGDDGRLVAFVSGASNLVPGDTNGDDDVFVRNRKRADTERVSVSSTGRQANGESEGGTLSATGRFVAFSSYASNLVRGDTNRAADVFVHDRWEDKTIRVSISSSGRQGNDDSLGGVVSADGRYVAFTSEASTLVDRDTNEARDVLVHDLVKAKTERVSVSDRERQANGGAIDISPAISAHGQFVAFDSAASNLVANDDNSAPDIFVRDRLTGTTRRASRGLGEKANDASFNPSISADGRFVAYGSWATNLVVGDTNEVMDVFVFDRLRNKTTRVSVSSRGEQGEGNRNPDDPGTFGHSGWASISSDGRFVAFDSSALNLVPEDTNASPDVFVHDRRTKTTSRVSVSAEGAEGQGWSMQPSISTDGRWVAFTSDAYGLVAPDENFVDAIIHGPLL